MRHYNYSITRAGLRDFYSVLQRQKLPSRETVRNAKVNDTNSLVRGYCRRDETWLKETVRFIIKIQLPKR